jgi:hypothetical protein
MSMLDQRLLAMKIKIPYDLKMKFLTMEGFRMDVDYYEINVMGTKQKQPGKEMISIELDLHNEPELLDCCIEWMHVVQNEFIDNSFLFYKVDIGPYVGLWPRSISDEGLVNFNVDIADSRRGNWKDWFIEGDIEYAPK